VCGLVCVSLSMCRRGGGGGLSNSSRVVSRHLRRSVYVIVVSIRTSISIIMVHYAVLPSLPRPYSFLLMSTGFYVPDWENVLTAATLPWGTLPNSNSYWGQKRTNVRRTACHTACCVCDESLRRKSYCAGVHGSFDLQS
jgi:hypothetical protein